MEKKRTALNSILLLNRFLLSAPIVSQSLSRLLVNIFLHSGLLCSFHLDPKC